ncbi:GPCR, rhodopsin-like, 7TM domain-containing protein [Strongyloides ratti]|uniref:GPCR, rhodopsin-like, 7TM domain-containing protein n=1 Tax=Strongyloides ratti TaxID=34506 RepID=A0A090LMT6_STRRB|nr:GPCR, rhodopsin-like, 7TM domain-containing protein [Strongyloides ratti]CEF71150.1 GPCR, rhodopsin-like, 7TM domain-containing protein [Strongyloides ratti]
MNIVENQKNSTIKIIDTGIHVYDEEYLSTWVKVSEVSWYVLVFLSIFSIITLLYTIKILYKHKKSPYYSFLMTMIIAHIIMLLTLTLKLTNVTFKYFHGYFECKLALYISNVTSCFCHWTWVMMYAQRLAIIINPYSGSKSGYFWKTLLHTNRILLITAIFSLITQTFSPFLITDIPVLDANGKRTGGYCDADSNLVSKTQLKWIVFFELMTTFFLPSSITILSDVGLLIRLKQLSGFKVTSSARLRNNYQKRNTSLSNEIKSSSISEIQQQKNFLEDSEIDCFETIKILSESGLKKCKERRNKAIKRCLLMASIQILFNTPHYLCNTLDTFEILETLTSNSALYVYADAISYVIYLLQFPMMLVYVNMLCPKDKEQIRFMMVRNTKILEEDISNR